MNIQSIKLDLFQKLLSVRSETVLKKISKILDKEVIVAYTVNGKPLTKEQYNKELEAGEQDIKNGDFYTQEEVEKIASKW